MDGCTVWAQLLYVLPGIPGDKSSMMTLFQVCPEEISHRKKEDGFGVASLGRSLANASGCLDCLFLHSVQDLLEVWEQTENGRLQGGTGRRPWRASRNRGLLGEGMGFR